MADAQVTIEAADAAGGGSVVRFAGPMVVADVEALRDRVRELPPGGPVTLDLRGAKEIDTAGAWLLVTLRRRLAAEGVETRIEGADEKQALIIDTVEKALPTEPAPQRKGHPFVDWVARLGEHTHALLTGAVEMTAFGGEIVACLGGTLVRPWRLRFTALVHHMQDVGLNAVPIVVLMAFLIGIVLAFMGAVQLRQFGAEVFVIDLIAITLLRELGILMTAIVVAGRTASAYTAAIGSMKLREEIDAMRTLSLDPMETLVLPRVLALVLTLPLLGFLANIAGLLGGGLMSWSELGISPALFIARLRDTGDAWTFLTGMIKAPFFAVVIGLVGCYEGMKVEKSAESLGQRTSDSVVIAIFLVIVLDAAFAVFFMEVGI
ncbi:ABC transporter permease [Amaricoccus sp.]|uniref:ABC transporter permease n=1 Tax=Amaricoccus sp. TaxID=1872485 RepID=UPI001B4240D0|nr:ABC transporter permease [Amaricoccus sp.]MBP7001806.1 ABC transporter permease [Amaricoccus sp.]